MSVSTPSYSPRSDSTGAALALAAEHARLAGRACRNWEKGGDPNIVNETAAVARHAALVAIEAVVSDEPWDDFIEEDPTTRRGRLAYAGWLTLMAGTDEHGESHDLLLAGQLFEFAARA